MALETLSGNERELGERVNRLVEELDIADRLLGEFKLGADGQTTLYQKHLGLLATFRRMVGSLLGRSDLHVICERVVRAIAEETRAEFCSIMLLDEERQELRLEAGASVHGAPPPGHRPRVFKVGEGLAGHVARTGEPLHIPDVEADTRWSVRPGAVQVRSFMCLPLPGSDGELVGVLNLSHPLPNAFHSDHLQLFEMLCPIVGSLIAFARVQESLRQLNSDLELEMQSLADHLPDSLMRFDAQGRCTYVSRRAESHLGVSSWHVLGRRLKELSLEPPFASRLTEALRAVFADGEPVSFVTDPESRADSVYLETRVIPERGRDGGIRTALVINRDITGLKRLEDQLRHAQKMEAVGTLAGGIAHDFNNLLTAILGFGSLMLEDLPPGHPMWENASSIQKAAEHAAALTRQLLAFSRKQILAPRVVDLNASVTSTEKMLRRLIGERIQLVTALEDELGQVRADPGQIEQVILNLVVNARDAMPGGGRLLVETRNLVVDEMLIEQHAEVRPGSYVVLSVSDTGVGMDRETSARIFEPFFTTKEVGKGTGLGLSTVYGIVAQSGGHISVYSEPGHGSTFRVYLPRAAGEERVAERGPSAPLLEARPGTVVLVEDEERVRQAVTGMLIAAGWRVLPAANGVEALTYFREPQLPVDLLLTDVVMPGMGGIELAEEIGRLRPGLPVVFMSGYTEATVTFQGLIEAGAQFLQKPFTVRSLRDKLASAVAPALAGASRQ